MGLGQVKRGQIAISKKELELFIAVVNSVEKKYRCYYGRTRKFFERQKDF